MLQLERSNRKSSGVCHAAVAAFAIRISQDGGVTGSAVFVEIQTAAMGTGGAVAFTARGGDHDARE